MERLKEIGRLIKRGKLVVNREKLLEAVSEFEDREVIIRRLMETSII
jgi:predicted nucleotidyltransferase